MKPEILLIEPMMAEIEDALRSAYIVHPYDGAADPTHYARTIRGIATGGGTGVPRAVMDSLPALEIIAINGIGTDAVDLKEAARRSIAVTTTPGVLTDDVADLALAFILTAMRDLLAGDRFVRDGQWGKGTLPLAHTASGRRLGILGMGQVGRAVARRARGFDMSIAYHDLKDLEIEGAAYVESLVELARQSDILVIAASGGPQSRHIVDRAVMEALGPHGLLVNVARGSVVDEEALVAALRDGVLGKAALDVFEHEPNVPPALWSMENTVLQPHRASATVETRLRMGRLVVDNLAAHFAGRPLLTPVR
ncbi:NAD(P)-dependent oxidoreductase [Gluconacetobacter takamatsuzukensis]|uniref:2-hydroxyacid dehydrogenase n=1 Tax=Gluconacetobacter takamatsuzukensis TaxID=1286190 RepID=A0A7W4KGT4_9PROT|nr:2-hydroxyacid dehydrogenase [Gluconacetobacter takamatsuzukensis]